MYGVNHTFYACLVTTIDIIYREKLLDVIDVRGVLGLLLVDGSLVSYRTPSGGYVQLTITAGANSSAYLEEKVKEFRQFIPTDAKIVHYKTRARSNGKTTPIMRFRASTNKLRPIYNLLYPSGEKMITQTAIDLLGAQAAAWCWAEGAQPNVDGSVLLTRVGATVPEAQLLSSWFEMLTGATSKIKEHYPRPRLTFSKTNAKKMRQALSNYAPHSRKHLFTTECWDAGKIRSARTELQLGKREAGAEGSAQAAMA